MIWQDLAIELAIWLGLACLMGALLTGVRMLLGELWPKGLLPPQRHFAAPWGIHEIVVVVLLCMVLVPGFLAAVLRDTAQLLGQAPPVDPEKATKAETIPFVLWGMVLGCVPAVRLSLRLLKFTSDTRPYQVGLRGDRLGADVTSGFLTWLALTPPILLIYVLLVSLSKGMGVEPEPHEFVKLVERRERSPLVLAGIVLTAVLAAPIVEEFLFRGLVQKWAALRRWGTDLVMGLAFAFALLGRGEQLEHVLELGWGGDPSVYLLALAPAVFVLAMIPGYIFAEHLAWAWLPVPNVARAIYAQGLLFAMVHDAWPGHIPLFLLGLGLGWLAYRTQSLIGPMVFHALFNAIACIGLVMEPQQPKGKPETTAVARPVAVSTATTVPGP